MTPITRRDALGVLGSVSVGALLGRPGPLFAQGESSPRLAPGAPASPERQALIQAFREKMDGIDGQFEARTHKGDWVMPYRLFRPAVTGKHPLVVYLHGSGGLGSDNQKQMGLGNVFGTRLWALPDSQKRFPCHVVAPQTDRGWVGDGARLAFDVIESLIRELPIDRERVYLTGQSMGGAGAWHMLAQRPRLFAAAAICCGSASPDDMGAVRTPVWNFHGDADAVVPVKVSRDRIASLRKAGGRPIHTEYAGVGHNSWEWAYTEPELLSWAFSKRFDG